MKFSQLPDMTTNLRINRIYAQGNQPIRSILKFVVIFAKNSRHYPYCVLRPLLRTTHHAPRQSLGKNFSGGVYINPGVANPFKLTRQLEDLIKL